MESIIKIGHKIQCIKDFKSFCNGEEKNIFIKDNIYDVVSGATGVPCIRIRENGDGYSFFNNSMDSYFKIIGATDDVIVTKDNINLYYEFLEKEEIKTSFQSCENCLYRHKKIYKDYDTIKCELDNFSNLDLKNQIGDKFCNKWEHKK